MVNQKFKNKYRIKSARLPNWDYRNNGIYFVTICTHKRTEYFGQIVDGIMQLNEIGELAHKFWEEIPTHFSFVNLGKFVVMPNHLHGILIIEKNVSKTEPVSVETLQCNVSTNKPNMANKPKTTDNTTINTNIPPKNQHMAHISPKPGSLSTIIRSYKSVVTKNARKIDSGFAWQTRFHDHIIRNEKAFYGISNYILNNPKNWVEDIFYV